MNRKKCGFLLFMIGMIALACSSGTRLQDYEPKNEQEKEIKNITKQIVKKYKPEKIILYGSFAYGKPHKDSDVDFFFSTFNAACTVSISLALFSKMSAMSSTSSCS